MRKGLIARETATSCNWRWQGCLFTSPSTLSAQTPSGWTWVPQPSPVCHVRARRGWSNSVRNWCPMHGPSAGCSARWIGKGEQPIPTITTHRGASRKDGKKKLVWKTSKGYEATRRRKASAERKQAAHRKSLHGCLVHQIVERGQHRHHRADFLQRLAETVRKERGAACSRDVHRHVETHRCKHGRHPARSSYTHQPNSPNGVMAVARR